MKDYEIGIVDLASVLRKYKRLIVFATAVCSLAAAVFTFSRPRTWEIAAVFYPARISAPGEDGEMKSLMVHAFKTLANQLETREFDPYVSNKSGLAMERIPRFHAARIPGTNQVRFSVQDNDIENSKLALTALLQILETDQNAMLDAKLAAAESEILELDTRSSALDDRIREAERDIAALDRERRTVESRIAASLEEEKALSLKIRAFEEKISSLEERYATMSARDDSEAAAQKLTVSNMILAAAVLAASNSDTLNSERKLREDLNRKVAEIVDQRGRFESRIMSLRGELSNISTARARPAELESGAVRAHLLTPPSALSRPVSRRGPGPVILGAALGFLLTFFPAVFFEIGKRAKQG